MKSSFSCIIVDDEPKAIELLADRINELYNNIDIVGTYTNWKDALVALREKEFDLLFLDISMPQKSGMDLLKLVPELKAEIIFVTAHSDYALNAFDFLATGYVLKPINDTILTKAIDRTLERIQNKQLAKNNANNSATRNLKIGVPNNRGLDYINIEDIIYLEATSRYTKVVKKEKEILSSYSIGKFKELMEDHLFCQVHRSFIINLNCVSRYESTGVIIMSNGKEIPVSKNFKDDFLRIFERVGKIIT